MLTLTVYGGTSMDIPQIRKLKPALKKFLKRFDRCFPRKYTRAHLPVYVSGQLSDLSVSFPLRPGRFRPGGPTRKAPGNRSRDRAGGGAHGRIAFRRASMVSVGR
jgi:hypothetical protein